MLSGIRQFRKTFHSLGVLFALSPALLAPRAGAQMVPGRDVHVSTGAPTVTPTVVAPGGTVALSTWSVRNQGTLPSGAFQNGYYLSTDPTITTSDRYLGGNSSPTLAPTARSEYRGVVLTIPAGVAEGRYYLGIIVDRTGAVAESNETNNTVARSIIVSRRPDLTVPGVPLLDSNVYVPGEPIEFDEVTVRNQGPAAAVGFYTGYYLSTDSIITPSDIRLADIWRAGLAANTSLTFPWWGGSTIPASTRPGTYYVGVYVDRGYQVGEADETNNAAVRPITVSGLPDLRISGLNPVISSRHLEAGQTFTLTGPTLKNRGIAAAGAFTVGFYLSRDGTVTAADTLLRGVALTGGLGAGAQTTLANQYLTIPAGTAAGNYTLGILLDSGGRVAEALETNNLYRMEISVGQYADLIISMTNRVVTPAVVQPGGAFTLGGFTVRNAGHAPINFLSYEGVFLSPDSTITGDGIEIPVATFGNGALGTGAYRSFAASTLTIPNGTPPGRYYVGVMADDLQEVSEFNETNNTVVSSNQIYVGSMPDLVILNGGPDVSPTKITRGRDLTVGPWAARNQGTVGCNPFDIGFYVSTDSVLDPNADTSLMIQNYSPALASGGQMTWPSGSNYRIPASLMAGIYYFGPVLDDGGLIAEAFENNNYSTRQVIIDDAEDTPGTADAIALPTSTKYSIQNKDDVDYFKVLLPGGVEYTISVTPETLGDSQLWLYAGDGVTPLAYNDDLFVGSGSEIRYRPLKSGYLYIKVAWGTVWMPQTGVYTLRVTAN